MHDISLGIEVYVISFFFFSAAVLPAVIVVYFINLWINREGNPVTKKRGYKPPVSKMEKLIRSSAGLVIMVFGLFVLSWPLYCAFVLRETEYLSGINFSGGLPVITLGMKKLSLVPSLIFTVGLILLRPLIAPMLQRKKDELKANILSRRLRGASNANRRNLRGIKSSDYKPSPKSI